MAKRDDPRDRLLDWLAFEFERRWYGQYVQIPADEELAKDRMEILWKILDHSLSQNDGNDCQHCINECILIFWPKETTSASGDAAVAKFFLCNRDGQTRVDKGRDPWNVVRAWLCPDNADDAILSDAKSRYRLLTGYFSFVTDGWTVDDLAQASDLLERPVYRRIPDKNHPEEWDASQRWVPIEGGTIGRDSPIAEGARYYQRIAIGFGCEDMRAFDRIAVLASRIASALVASWSYELEEERVGISHLQAWAHETRSCVNALNDAADSLDRLTGSSCTSTAISQIVRDCADWLLLYSATGKRNADLGPFSCNGVDWKTARQMLLGWAAKVSRFRKIRSDSDALQRAVDTLPCLVRDTGFLAGNASKLRLQFPDTRLELQTGFVQSFVAATTNAFSHVESNVANDQAMIILAYNGQSTPHSFYVINRLSRRHQQRICRNERITLPDISAGTQLAIKIACEGMGFWSGKGSVFFDGVPIGKLNKMWPMAATDVQRLWPSETAVWVTRFPVPQDCLQFVDGELP